MNISVLNNKYNFEVNDLMAMANRLNNTKRNFLFVSKVLGKHLEVKPDVCKAVGRLLVDSLYKEAINTNILVDFIKGNEVDIASLKNELNTPVDSSEKVYVLGFAETATGLGMAVASSIKDCFYQTTTREDILNIDNMLSFEEEHSHATNHKCFTLYNDAIKKADRIILVDDEITTGKSMVNLIRELSTITDVKNFTILSILDWRNDYYRKYLLDFKNELSLNIDVLSLVSGEYKSTDNSTYEDDCRDFIKETSTINELNVLDRISLSTKKGQVSYYRNSGRFGVYNNDILSLEDKCRKAAEQINKLVSENKKILVLGHGEDIYIPSRVASYIKGDVYFKSTTRSPICCTNKKGYPIKSRHSFLDGNVEYFIYNKEEIENKYDKVILLTEKDLNVKLTSNVSIFKL